MEIEGSQDPSTMPTGITLQRQSTAGERSSTCIRPIYDLHLDLSLPHSTPATKLKLINAINHTHFKNEYLWAHIRGRIIPEELLVKVYPGPCLQDVVVCHLGGEIDIDLEHYHIEHLVIEDGKSALVIPITVQTVSSKSITAQLPAQGFKLSTRKVRRLAGQGIVCEINQDTVCLQTHLHDFSISGFRLGWDIAEENISRIETSLPIQVRMYKNGTMVFAGSCRILRRETKGQHHFLVLKPVSERTSLSFRRKRIRNPRLCLVPTPKAVFNHPLSNNPVSFEIFDITTSGFSLHEHIDDAVLLPGMLIPHLTLLLGSNIEIVCSAQILHAHRTGNRIRIGCAIRDMELNTYVKFYDILANALDRHANSRLVPDMNALWDIFFETGFIYPQKYAYLSSYRDAFKETYRRLYQNGKDIFFHFTYQQNGRIYGHISFVRAYQRLWMIHHFAARPMHGQRRIGLEVYKHIFNLYDTARRLPSAKLDYIMFYFRPTNDFNMYFQAGFCRMMNNPRVCSMDLFSYQYWAVSPPEHPLPPGWTLDILRKEDIGVLRSSYDSLSGGLFLDALGIGKTYPDEEQVEETYAHLGLTRRTTLYALQYEGHMKAALIIDQSDIGINLSELLNCIKVMVIDQDDMPGEILATAISHLTLVYETGQVPVMIHPYQYAENNGFAGTRAYYLWILDSRYADIYIRHMKKKIQIPPIRLLFRALLKNRQRRKITT